MSDLEGILMNDVIESVGRRPLLLTPMEAAEVLRIGRTQIFELIATGALNSVKIGRSRRIPVSACEEYVDRLRQGA